MKIYAEITSDLLIDPTGEEFHEFNNDTKQAKFMLSPVGMDFIKLQEGYRAVAYRDSAGIPTIGYGTIKHDGVRVRLGDTCTKEQATKWLHDFVEREVEEPLNKLITVPITQDIFDALGSFVYNNGYVAFSKSTLLRLLNNKEYERAADELLKWNKVRVNGVLVENDGLTKRRKAEREIFIASINDLRNHDRSRG